MENTSHPQVPFALHHRRLRWGEGPDSKMIPARRAHPPIASPNGRRSGRAEPPDRSKAAAETQLSSEAAERTLSYRPREAADRGGRFLHEKKMPAPLNSRRGRRRRRSGQTWTRGQAEEKAGVWGGAGSGELAGLLPREARAVVPWVEVLPGVG